jgi:hypothetical protein
MTVKEKLLEEIECAINAVLGDCADKEFEEEYVVDKGDIDLIAKKTKFYMDL